MIKSKPSVKQMLKTLLLSQIVFFYLIAKYNGNEKSSTSYDLIGNIFDSSLNWKFKYFQSYFWKYNQKITLQQTESILIEDKNYFRRINNSSNYCFVPGTDFHLSTQSCWCKNDYFGIDCGIPSSAWFGHFKYNSSFRNLRVRKKPRRIIHALLVNHEFDFFETRVRTLQDVVDVFIIQESKYTTFGEEKRLNFLEKLKTGWLSDQQNKIIYILLDHFSKRGEENGWYADAYIRGYLTKQGLKLIYGAKDDDLFIITDSDEIPTKESLLFLKLYEGFNEPISFGFRWTIFGFFWLKAEDPDSVVSSMFTSIVGKSERLLKLYIGCSVGMFRTVYRNNGMLLRRNVWRKKSLRKGLKNYISSGNVIEEWTMGTIGHYAGYHCSWCYDPKGIRTKLLSAQKNDTPRWGDYPEKTNLTYIESLIKNGQWFDGEYPFIEVKNTNEKFYAPSYMIENSNKFKYLLEKP